METEIQACEVALAELRMQYDQYFAGMSRRPPLQEEGSLSKRIAKLRASRGSATSRFRVEALHQRLMSYGRMWARTVREIEEGTYKRHVQKARERQAGATAGAAPVATAATATKGGRGGEDAKLRRLYDAWIEARERCNQGKEAPTFQQMESSIRKQVPALMKKYGASRVDFQVVIRDGKAVLKAVPKA